MQHDYDVLIIGGGLAGNCLALSLKESGLRTAIVEANTRRERRDSPAGDRALALSRGTVLMLEAIGIWQGVRHVATSIKHIHISDRGHFGKTRLSADQEGVEALGYVITARDLEEHVSDLVEQAAIEQICPARVIGLINGDDAAHISLKLGDDSVNYSARLLVGADGGNSSVRKLLEIALQKTEYGQAAIVTTVNTAMQHHNVAYERFTEFGPLAMLPVAKDQCAVVWTRTHEDAKDSLAINEDLFINQLQDCFGYRLGELTLTAPRRAFPLSLVRAERMFAGRAVIIGNAVHQLHPVAGQGFNLGLRDVVQLAEMLIQRHHDEDDIGGSDFLGAYADCRLRDHDRITGFTDYLVRIFSNDWLPVTLARNAGLALLDQIPVAKTYLTRYAMGLEGRMPRVGSRR